jgi:hypothetical protein
MANVRSISARQATYAGDLEGETWSTPLGQIYYLSVISRVAPHSSTKQTNRSYRNPSGGSMARNDDNVIPLRRSWSPYREHLPVPINELSEAVRAFSALTHCLDEMTSGRYSPVGILGAPTTQLRLHLPAVERCLGQLRRVGVMNWPDTRWALRLCNARSEAAARLQDLETSLYPSQPYFDASGNARRQGQIVADAEEFVEAICKVRDLIVERYPQTQWTT